MKTTRLTNKRIVIFLVLATIFMGVLSLRYAQNKNPNYLVGLMFTPMISVILTRVLTKEKAQNLFLRPFFKQNKWYYLLAYFATPIIAFSGAAVYFFFFPDQLDFLGSKFAYQSDLTTAGAYFKQLAIIVPLCILVNPLGGLLSCFGEEFAWRGYLLPKLSEKFSRKKAVVLTGFIWGVWHAPLVYMGLNYGTDHPALGIAMMIFFCMVMNTILSSLFFKTKSVWVCVVAHAALNAIDKYTPSYLFTSMKEAHNLFIGPNLVGIIGGLGFIIVAIFCYKKMNQI